MQLAEATIAYINIEKAAKHNEFNRRRKVFIVAWEFIRHELGLERPEFKPSQIEYVFNELLIRQLLPSSSILKAVTFENANDAWKFYVISPDFDLIEPYVSLPETVIY